jgi:hypothetical protein
VCWDRFDVIGERLLDLSPQGALLACDDEVTVGDEVLLAFRMPWLGPDVLVSAEVARVVAGRRASDPGRCAGLRFVDLDPQARAELRARLAMLEPAAPARPHAVDYAASVRMLDHGAPPDAGVLVEDHVDRVG